MAHIVADLHQRIQNKIAALRAVEEQLPVVVIIHDIIDSTVVYMSERGLRHLGVSLDEVVNMEADYYNRFFNAEDARDYVPKILALLQQNNDDEVVSYFQQVRSSPAHDWSWYLSCTKIFMRSDEGNPILTITTATPVDAQHHMAAKAQRLLDENNFLRKHHQEFVKLGKREKEILRLMAQGLSSAAIAEQLHISEATAATHRRNIRKKLNIRTSYDLSLFAQAFDLV
jgi:DNA-binding CsgD family transcriptional regulator